VREPRIYIDDTLKCGLELTLPEQASQHIGKVLRMKVGQQLWLFNGEGGCYLSTITAIKKRAVDVEIESFKDEIRESTLRITLVQAVSRSQHMDYTIQKAVELGVVAIVPVRTEFCNVRFDELTYAKKLLHWQGIIISACEQCGRNKVPDISEPVTLSAYLAMQVQGLKLFLHPGADKRLRSFNKAEEEISLLSGPEGGFSSQEIEQVVAGDYHGVDLGPRVLRTETAAIAAISACQALWGDMG